ncbi:MAG: glycosyltransferase family 4 protein [Bdellovibrionales bacterium]
MKKKRLIVLSDISYPDTNAGASRIYERLKYWKDSYDVHLVTQHAANGKKIQKEVEDLGFKVTRFPRSPFKGKGLFSRAISYLWFSDFSFFYLLFSAKKGDVLFTTSPQFLNLVVAYIISGFKRTKLVFEISDLWPDILLELDVLSSKSIVYKVWSKLEKFLYKKADAIIALTPGVKSRIVSKGVLENKVTSIINGFDEKLWKEKAEKQNSKFIVGYYGTLGRVIDISLFLDTAKSFHDKFPEEKVEFHLAGQGIKEVEILDFIKTNQAVSLKFLGELPKEQMQGVWEETGVCFIPLVDLPVMESCIPAKLLECIGVGVPLLLSGPNQSDGAKLIEDYGFGKTIKPSEKDQIVDVLKNWCQKPDEYQRALKSMRENRKAFTREKQASSVLDAVNSL